MVISGLFKGVDEHQSKEITSWGEIIDPIWNYLWLFEDGVVVFSITDDPEIFNTTDLSVFNIQGKYSIQENNIKMELFDCLSKNHKISKGVLINNDSLKIVEGSNMIGLYLRVK